MCVVRSAKYRLLNQNEPEEEENDERGIFQHSESAQDPDQESTTPRNDPSCGEENINEQKGINREEKRE